MQLSEGQDAHFRCQLSRACSQEARWALGGVPLQANEMNDITVEHGTLHLLTLHKVASLGPAPAAVLPGCVCWGMFPLHLDQAGVQVQCSLGVVGWGGSHSIRTRLRSSHSAPLGMEESSHSIQTRLGSSHGAPQVCVGSRFPLHSDQAEVQPQCSPGRGEASHCIWTGVGVCIDGTDHPLSFR